jgi:hypothetical protein
MTSIRNKKADRLKAREDGWNLQNPSSFKLKEYNALFDPNMRHFFENSKIQNHLYNSGQIDRHGRCIDLQKNKDKIAILEREFQAAELAEEKRMKEELEMRYRVQRKRFADLEKTRKEEILEKLKMDRAISKEIIAIMTATNAGNLQNTGKLTGGSKRSNKSTSLSRIENSESRDSGILQNSGFFVTEGR